MPISVSQLRRERIRLPRQRSARERLAGKHLHNRADRIQLKVLMTVEFDLHCFAVPSAVRASCARAGRLLHKRLFQLPQLLVEQVVGLVDQANEDIPHHSGGRVSK